MKIAEIQALRAFAAFLVLFYHIRETELAHAALTGSKTAPLMNIFDTGFAGVDLFFAVSGFVMVYVTYKIPASLHRTGDFWLARVFRIYPTWWLYCALFSVLCLIMAGTLWIPGSINPATTDPSLFLLKSWFLIPQPDLPQINVGWTLVHEIHFYMVFGLLLLLPRKMLLAALLVWAALLVAIRFAYPALEMRSSYLAIALSPYSLEFIGGAFAGWLVVTGRRRFALPVLLLGLAGFAAGLYLISDAPLRRTSTPVLWTAELESSRRRRLLPHGRGETNYRPPPVVARLAAQHGPRERGPRDLQPAVGHKPHLLDRQ